MGVVIETHFWEPSNSFYIFIFVACFASIFFRPHFSDSTRSVPVIDSSPASFSRFQRRFLFVYSICSVIGGLHSVFGEVEFSFHGFSREQMVAALATGCAAALVASIFLGVFSDFIGHKKACLLFCILHVFVGLLKCFTRHPSIIISSVCLAIMSSIFGFSFESWMVVEHEKVGHKQDFLVDTFWLMTFSESASLIGSQALANLLVSWDPQNIVALPSLVAAILAVVCIIYISRWWSGIGPTSSISNYKMVFSACILKDKRIWPLCWAQACLDFSVKVFWIFWAPTIVADGRQIRLSMIYPCLLGAQMLGSTSCPWFLSGPLLTTVEDLLAAAFSTASLALFVVAHDYQEIKFLVAVFCIFLSCVGLISPSLARMRTMLVPNEVRAGMMSVSSVLANGVLLLILIQNSQHRNLSNSSIMSLSGLGLSTAAICIYLLKRWTKHHQEWHKL
ncbi:hypothetical protein H6P81_012738 [Aristolochia fimbriata]|uniref:Molybdate-anion transporter-like n=1 Tax=Aristolochia fimbriata TaxID=158543 RepID=A0AAV7ECM5_ARIFI|nr:hypothetical protein H6P81_012738 [Aristolochia fimbriata]